MDKFQILQLLVFPDGGSIKLALTRRNSAVATGGRSFSPAAPVGVAVAIMVGENKFYTASSIVFVGILRSHVNDVGMK